MHVYNKKFILVVILLLVVIVGFVVYFMNSNSNNGALDTTLDGRMMTPKEEQQVLYTAAKAVYERNGESNSSFNINSADWYITDEQSDYFQIIVEATDVSESDIVSKFFIVSIDDKNNGWEIIDVKEEAINTDRWVE